MKMQHRLSRLLRIALSAAVLLSLTAFQHALSIQPNLAFSDLVTGPDTGLGDGKGQGVIVTVWGQNLGSSQGESKLLFKDTNGTAHEPYIYYWKNSDGSLPSGPANLHESHRMQEIAFSVPESADGPAEIIVEVDGMESNSLSFTVRSGSIFHVKSSGDDSSDGSWSSPWRTVDHAGDAAPSGSTIYIHDVDTGDSNSARAIYWNTESSSSSLSAQFGFIAYPGFHPKAIAQRAVENYKIEAMVVSKLDVYASNYKSVDSNDQPTGGVIESGETYGIQSSKNGRVVGNRITDIVGGCASKTAGAIHGNAAFGNDRVSNFKAYGNEIYEYGCAGSSKLHHTTYMSIRSAPHALQVEPWEFGFNYLHDNPAKFGIHQFDQNDDCGDATGPLKIFNNVVVNQGGAGISIGSQCDWSMDSEIENNVLINVGLAAAWDGVDPSTSDGPENGGIAIRDSGLLGTMYVRNNLVYRFNSDFESDLGGSGCLNFNGSGDNVSVVWNNNTCISHLDLPLVGAGYQGENKLDNVSGSHNAWYYTGSSPTEAVVPSWDTNPIDSDPEVTFQGVQAFISADSPLIDSAMSVPLEKGIYGTPRGSSPDVGPVEFVKAPPKPPEAVTIQ